ncbi:hypothetical protein [Kitasatospora sp. NPDC093679]|uniref:hypothetical protein n=1 Tax=Kitasatospora sp. NPDC093679 TaxID=3154983 RepID=UPI0034173974
MTKNQKPRDGDDRRVGVRPQGEVEQAFEELEVGAAAPDRQTQAARGSLNGYLWALGRSQTAPVSGERTEDAPDLKALTEEVETIEARLEDEAAHTPVPPDYGRGARDALAWVCGRDEKRT